MHACKRACTQDAQMTRENEWGCARCGCPLRCVRRAAGRHTAASLDTLAAHAPVQRPAAPPSSCPAGYVAQLHTKAGRQC